MKQLSSSKNHTICKPFSLPVLYTGSSVLRRPHPDHNQPHQYKEAGHHKADAVHRKIPNDLIAINDNRVGEDPRGIRTKRNLDRNKTHRNKKKQVKIGACCGTFRNTSWRPGERVMQAAIVLTNRSRAYITRDDVEFRHEGHAVQHKEHAALPQQQAS